MTSELEQMHALRRLADDYALAMDNCDVPALADLFTPTGALVVKRPGSPKVMGTFRGPGPDGVGLIALLMRKRYDRTMHHVTTHSAAIDGDGATGTTLCLAYHIGGEGDGLFLETLGVRYDDSFVRTDSGWRFDVREATRQWSQITPIPYEPLLIDRAAATATRSSTTGS